MINNSIISCFGTPSCTHFGQTSYTHIHSYEWHLLYFWFLWVSTVYDRKFSFLIYLCSETLSNSNICGEAVIWLSRQQFQRCNIMSSLINETALLSFQIWFKVAHRVQLHENISLRKTAEAQCPNHRLPKSWLKMTVLDGWPLKCWWVQWAVEGLWFVLSTFTVIDGPDLASCFNPSGDESFTAFPLATFLLKQVSLILANATTNHLHFLHNEFIMAIPWISAVCDILEST